MTTRVIVTILLSTVLSPAAAGTRQQQSPKKKPAAVAKAQEHYQMTCQPCHGVGGVGVLPGTELTSGKWKHGSSLQAIAKTITDGVPNTAMLPAAGRFTKAEILELAKLVRSFDKTPRRKPPVKK